MFLIRQRSGSTSVCYELDENDATGEFNGAGRMIIRRREPGAWRWSNWSGCGVTAIGRTRDEAERLIRELFWSEAA